MQFRWLFPLLALAACQIETISSHAKPDEVFVLTRFNDMPMAERITLQFPERFRIAGQGPCNRYFAEQPEPLPWFDLGPIGATRRACPALDLEQRYFAALDAVQFAERAGDVVLLTNESGLELVFRLEK